VTIASLDRQTVLITGAANGLGRALATAFDKAGSNLILLDVNVTALEETAQMLSRPASLHVVDLSDTAATAAAVADIRQKFPILNTLIHNAGYLVPKPYAAMEQKDWDTTFNVGVQAAHLLTKAWWSDWLQTGATVIYVSSRSGIEGGSGHSAYVATKHALEGLVKVLGEEGKDAGILINTVTPGWYMRTPMSEQNHPVELRAKWVDAIRFTAGFLYLAERRNPALSGQRLSAWDLSEQFRDLYPFLD